MLKITFRKEARCNFMLISTKNKFKLITYYLHVITRIVMNFKSFANISKENEERF